MSTLRAHYRDFMSFWKRQSRSPTDILSNTLSNTPDIEQAHHQEQNHHEEQNHHQEQQWSSDTDRDVDVEAVQKSKPAFELGGFLGIAELQASDKAYQNAPNIDGIYSYVTQKRYLRIKRTWKEIISAIKSGDSCLEEELEIGLGPLCDTYYDSICKQSQVNHLARPSKIISEKLIHELKAKIGADVEYIEDDPSNYLSYGQQDVPHAAARRFLEFSWVYRSLEMFKARAVSGEHSDYLHFADEVVLVIKMLLMLFVVIIFVYVPVVIPGLGVVNSPAGIAVLYAAFISLSSVATTSTLDVNTAIAVQLAYAGLLGNVLFPKGAAQN
ncbi:hypothetical protein ACHAQJ_006889 [Trichoderma viride]